MGCLVSSLSLQALRYTGSHTKVHFPTLVENEILKEDGSVIKRFALAWIVSTNTLKSFPTLRKKNGAPAHTLKPLGQLPNPSPQDFCQVADVSACHAASGHLCPPSPPGVQ